MSSTTISEPRNKSSSWYMLGMMVRGVLKCAIIFVLDNKPARMYYCCSIYMFDILARNVVKCPTHVGRQAVSYRQYNKWSFQICYRWRIFYGRGPIYATTCVCGTNLGCTRSRVMPARPRAIMESIVPSEWVSRRRYTCRKSIRTIS